MSMEMTPRSRLLPSRAIREFEDMERHFEDLFGRPYMLPSMWRNMPAEKMWMPAIDVFEQNDKFIVKAELPGMKEEEIDIEVVGDTLNIKGEKKTESEVKDKNYYRSERSYGSFSRSIVLPSNIEADKIEAKYEDGVLEVSLPKIAQAKPKKITVTASKAKKDGK